MGYKRNPKVYNLVFGADTEYPGLEVQVRTLTMGQLLSIWTSEGLDSAYTFELFVTRLVGWNLEDDVTGEPVPLTREAVEAEDDDMIQAVIARWIAEVKAVSAPLGSDSGSGETSPVESMLTEIPSQSLAS